MVSTASTSVIIFLFNFLHYFGGFSHVKRVGVWGPHAPMGELTQLPPPQGSSTCRSAPPLPLTDHATTITSLAFLLAFPFFSIPKEKKSLWLAVPISTIQPAVSSSTIPKVTASPKPTPCCKLGCRSLLIYFGY